MTAPSLGRLLISHITLRGPELEQLYGSLVEHPGATYEELGTTLVPAWQSDANFGLDEAAMREALNFLLVAGLVAQQGDSRRKANFQVTSLPPTLASASFPLLLLYHIGRHGDQRQRAIVSVQRQLVQHDTLAITVPGLRDQLERGPIANLFAWTGEKVSFWTHLAAYVGLVRRLERSLELLVVPRFDLVFEALSWASDQLNSYPQSAADSPGMGYSTSLYSCLQRIDDAFFACFTATGRVHRGLAQTLIAMHQRGYLMLTHSADAARSVLLGDWRVSEVRLPSSVWVEKAAI